MRSIGPTRHVVLLAEYGPTAERFEARIEGLRHRPSSQAGSLPSQYDLRPHMSMGAILRCPVLNDSEISDCTLNKVNRKPCQENSGI